MRNLINTLGAAAFGLLALAVVTVAPIQQASASDFCPAKYSDPRYIRFECADIVSNTTVAAIGDTSVNPRRDLTVSLRGIGTGPSVTIILKAGGQVVDQVAVAVPNGSAVTAKFTAPLYFDSFTVSPTTSLSTGTVDVNAVSAKK